MSTLEPYRKQAKLLVRWHRERNYSIGGRIRSLPRYSMLTDNEALALKFPLSEAQEIIAREAGFESWSALKVSVATAPSRPTKAAGNPALKRALPVVFVSNVSATAAFFRDSLGFTIDFLHGHPAFYGAVSRDGATLHLRFTHEPVISAAVREQEQLISAFIEVEKIKELFLEYKGRNVDFQATLQKEAWGGSTFYVRDPDGNWICFAG